jgi:hypothetical protein
MERLGRLSFSFHDSILFLVFVVKCGQKRISMGMFDTFHTTWQGRHLDLQLKDFGCDLSDFWLGDCVDSSQRGVGFFILDFGVAVDFSNPIDSGSFWGSNRFLLGILKDGVWIDYAVYSTQNAAESSMPYWVSFYKNPAALNFAWQSLHSIARHMRWKIDRESSNLRTFVRDFEERKKPRKTGFGGGFLHRIWKTTPKRLLTLNKLIDTLNQFFTRTSKESLPSEYEAWRAHSFYETPGYFYDGPTYPQPYALQSLEGFDLSSDAASQLLLTHLQTFDFKFFECLSIGDPLWFSKTSPTVQNALAIFSANLTRSRVLSFGWLWLKRSLGTSVSIFQEEMEVEDGSAFPPSLWTHFLSLLGADESWVLEAMTYVPSLPLSSNTLPALAVPKHYQKLQERFPLAAADFANVLVGGQPVLHRLFLDLLLNYGAREERLQLYRSFEAAGVDVFLLDPKGNTSVMALFQLLNNMDPIQAEQHQWIFQDDHSPFGTDGAEASLLLKKLLVQHPIDARNHEGQTMMDLFPKQFHLPESLVLHMQHHALITQHPISEKYVTQAKRTAL